MAVKSALPKVPPKQAKAHSVGTRENKTMRALITIAVVILSVVVTFGQTNEGGISGTVAYANGAAIPGATVTITNIGTGQNVTVKTSESGTYIVQSLDPVTYSVLVEASNFKKTFIDQVKVDTAAVVTTNVM